MIDFVRELPEWAKSCDYFDEMAEGYLCFLMNGKSYYIPLTAEIKSLFGISRRGDKLIFKVGKNRRRMEDMLRVMAGSLLLQVRDTVGASISSDLSRQVTEFLEEKLEPGLDALVGEKMNRKLLVEGDES